MRWISPQAAEAARDALTEIGKASPPIAVILAAQNGINWQKWVWVVTFLYVGLQFGLLVWDRIVKPVLARRRRG